MTLRKVPSRYLDRLPGRIAGYLERRWFPELRGDAPFDGMIHREKAVHDLLERFQFRAVVEIGTGPGLTTLRLRELSGLPVFTVETSPRTFASAGPRLRKQAGIHRELAGYQAFLQELRKDASFPHDCVFFYFHPHKGVDRALEWVALNWSDPVIALDGIQVPDDSAYVFPDEGPGRRLTATSLPPALTRDFRLFWPATPGESETGARRGWVVAGRRELAANRLEEAALLREILCCGDPEEAPYLFTVGDPFEADNIYAAVVGGDEYQLGDTRFQPDDAIVDVGAHIGAFSYLCHAKGSRSIHCYEPGERNFMLLQRNLGSRPGVRLSRAAVWRSDSEAETELVLSGPAGRNTGAATVLAGGRIFDFPAQKLSEPDGPPRTAPAIPLDRILEKFERVKLLKVDCEGSEFPILLTSRCLGRVERIVAEVHEIGEPAMALLDARSVVAGCRAYTVELLAAKLRSNGFQVSIRPGDCHMFLLDARRSL